VYPNPFQTGTTLLVSGSDNTEYTYTIYAISGQIVETGTGTSGQTTTIAESISNGMYMLTINTATKTQTVKIIKK